MFISVIIANGQGKKVVVFQIGIVQEQKGDKMKHEVIVEIEDEYFHKYVLDGCREIIRCKDCKYSEHWRRDERMCSLWDDAWVFDDGFCNHAKRRTDETD